MSEPDSISPYQAPAEAMRDSRSDVLPGSRILLRIFGSILVLCGGSWVVLAVLLPIDHSAGESIGELIGTSVGFLTFGIWFLVLGI